MKASSDHHAQHTTRNAIVIGILVILVLAGGIAYVKLANPAGAPIDGTVSYARTYSEGAGITYQQRENLTISLVGGVAPAGIPCTGKEINNAWYFVCNPGGKASLPYAVTLDFQCTYYQVGDKVQVFWTGFNWSIKNVQRGCNN